ncbi:SH3 domain-containing protein [Bacillus cereus]|uniref:SH3 domain-containing protein n=1 Tax=Bacillus cereus TaxID=1396 RepID=UPI003BF63893
MDTDRICSTERYIHSRCCCSTCSTGPANYHPVIGGVLKGQSLQVVDIENGWYKIKYNNRTGYVSGEFVKFLKGSSTQEQTQTKEKLEQAQQPNHEQEENKK